MSQDTSDFMQLNIITLQQQRPELLDLAGTTQEATGFDITTSPNGQPNIQAPHPATNAQLLVHDPTQIDQSFANLFELLNKEQEALIFLVGMGLGYEAKLLLSKFPKFRFAILEPSSELFASALKEADLTPVLASPNVSLHVGKDIDIAQLLLQEDDAMRALPRHLISHSKLLELFPEIYKPLHKKLQEGLLHFKGRLDTIEKHGPLLFRNTLANIPQLADSSTVWALKNACQGMPAICVASGPSLDKNIEQLKENRERALIIAVDSALPILKKHGISPHLVATIEAISASYTKFEATIGDQQAPPLIFSPEAFPKTVKNYPSPYKFHAPATNDFFKSYLQPVLGETGPAFRGVLGVTLQAVQIAALAGCDPVICIGLDLAIQGTQDHAEGSPVKWSDLADAPRLTVPAWAGGTVETIPVLNSQRLELESLLVESSINCINATEGGARIEGTTPMPLREALELYGKEEVHPEEKIKQLGEGSFKPEKNAVITALQALLSELDETQKLCKIGLRDGKEAKKLWRASKKPRTKQQKLGKFKKKIISYGEAADALLAKEQLIHALFPMRVKDHHRLVYARKKYNEKMSGLTPQERIFAELAINLDYFTSWQKTVNAVRPLLRNAIEELREAI